jgi:DNA mismatch repair protein MutS
MAGKSTYLRQAALIAIMAQAGSFVPAASAKIGVTDRIYCRVGATDNLARGESTFLVEMNETANILNTATKQSLVIMDEVGRGTGANDGLSIAWAVSEELLNRIKCRTFFATHYHELSMLSHPGMANRSMEVLDQGGEIVFLRKLKEGSAAESYGLHVARLAGLGEDVLIRAAEIMERIKEGEKTLREALPGARPPERSFAVTEAAAPANPPAWLRRIADDIAALDLNTITPLDAMNRIQGWKALMDGGGIPKAAGGRSAGNPRQKAAGPTLFD